MNIHNILKLLFENLKFEKIVEYLKNNNFTMAPGMATNKEIEQELLNLIEEPAL